MITILDTAFTTGSDQDIDAFDALFLRRLGSPAKLTVRASDDVVITDTSSVDVAYVYDTSPFTKGQVTSSVFVSGSSNYAAIFVRATRTGNFNAYAVEVEAGSGEVGIYRVINGAFTSLADVSATTGSVPASTFTTVVVDIDTVAGNPVIGVTVAGGTRATFTDTDGAKITGTGYAGLGDFQSSADGCRHSTLKIESDDAAAGGAPRYAQFQRMMANNNF